MPASEFFGPDFGRGPFTGHRLDTAAVQIAAALAQLRAPLLRSDDEIRTHADFIREIADRLAPEFASQVFLDVADEDGNAIDSVFRVHPGAYTLLHCWLADDLGKAPSSVTPDDVEWSDGVVVHELTARSEFIVLTDVAGVISARVSYTGARSWRWAVTRTARVYYSSALTFT